MNTVPGDSTPSRSGSEKKIQRWEIPPGGDMAYPRDKGEWVKYEDHSAALTEARAEAEKILRDLWKARVSSWMRFWLCQKCQHVGTGQRDPHPCAKCGNKPRDGYFTEGTFDQWAAQNEDDFKIWREGYLKTAALKSQPAPSQPGGGA